MWGSCEHADRIEEATNQSTSAQNNKIDYCSITSLTVEQPVKGTLYADLYKQNYMMSGLSLSIFY